MKDELLDETELYPFAEDEKGVSFLVRSRPLAYSMANICTPSHSILCLDERNPRPSAVRATLTNECPALFFPLVHPFDKKNMSTSEVHAGNLDTNIRMYKRLSANYNIDDVYPPIITSIMCMRFFPYVIFSPVSSTNVVRQVPRAHRHHHGRRHAHSLRPAPQRGDRLPHAAIGHHV